MMVTSSNNANETTRLLQPSLMTSSTKKKFGSALAVAAVAAVVAALSFMGTPSSLFSAKSNVVQPVLPNYRDPIRDLLKQLNQQLPTGRVVADDDDPLDFKRASEIWNKCTKAPRAVVECSSEQDVQVAIPVLRQLQDKYGVAFRIKSGGHSYTGWSGIKDGIILSVKGLSSVELDTETGIVTVGPGATVQDVRWIFVNKHKP